MDRSLAPCRDCAVAVPADATTCPACGYTVADHDRRRFALGVTGTALTLSLVFAPVGLPLVWSAHRHRLAAAGTVTSPEGVAPFDHVTELLGRWLSLESSRDSVSRPGPVAAREPLTGSP